MSQDLDTEELIFRQLDRLGRVSAGIDKENNRQGDTRPDINTYSIQLLQASRMLDAFIDPVKDDADTSAPGVLEKHDVENAMERIDAAMELVKANIKALSQRNVVWQESGETVIEDAQTILEPEGSDVSEEVVE